MTIFIINLLGKVPKKVPKTQDLRRAKSSSACRGGCLDPNKNEQDEMFLAWNRSAS